MEFNSSYTGLRSDIIKYIVGKGKVILDVGCATGINGKYLKDEGFAAKVIGIELDSSMAAEAKGHLDEVIIGNIEDDFIYDKLLGEYFDYILLGDVLEHLYDPWSVLNRLKLLLTSNGKLIISLPNIQHIELLMSVYIQGKWPYNDRGIFDKTHLRWFTHKNILELEERCNIRILKLERKFRYRDRIGSEFPFYGKLLKKVCPNLFTFQYIVVAEKWKQESML